MVQFNFSYAEGTSLQQILLFETAGNIWGEYLKDDVVVNIHAGVVYSEELPEGVIGGALPGVKARLDYGEFLDSYEQDVTSKDDASVHRSLNPRYDGAQFEFKGQSGGYDSGNDGSWLTHRGNTQQLDLTRANAKALGLSLENPDGLDGYIMISDLEGSGVGWDEDSSRTKTQVEASKLEMLTVVMHEIGHVLGFVSSLDDSKKLQEINQAKTDWQRQDAIADLGDSSTPMDLLRFSRGNGDPQQGRRFDLSYGNVGGEKYFSVNGGETKVAEFATGVDKSSGGDGYQASHWKRGKEGKAKGIMDPALSLGQRGEITKTDLRLFDALGWDLPNQYWHEDQEQRRTGQKLTHRALYEDVKFFKRFYRQYAAAEREMAQELGMSVWELRDDAEATAEALTQDRDFEVLEMLVNSDIYDLGWWNKASQAGSSLWLAWRNWTASGGRGLWEVMDDVFQARGLYSTLDLGASGEMLAAVEPTDAAGPEDIASENIASENIASENIASENIASENIASANEVDLLTGIPLSPEAGTAAVAFTSFGHITTGGGGVDRTGHEDSVASDVLILDGVVQGDDQFSDQQGGGQGQLWVLGASVTDDRNLGGFLSGLVADQLLVGVQIDRGDLGSIA